MRRAPALFEAAPESGGGQNVALRHFVLNLDQARVARLVKVAPSCSLVAAAAARLATANSLAALAYSPARPTKRAGARRKALAGRGFAPHEPTGPWAGLFRLGPKFGSRLPPTLGGRLGPAHLRGAALNACPRCAVPQWGAHRSLCVAQALMALLAGMAKQVRAYHTFRGHLP